MSWIHVRLDLEDETAEGRFIRRHIPIGCLPYLGRRRPVHELIEHFTNAEVAKGSAKKHRTEFPGQEGLEVKRVTGATHQLDFLTEVGVFPAQ